MVILKMAKMTKQYFSELADYNCWANDIACGWLEATTDDQWNQPIVSSFNNLRETLLHIAASENVWAERMNGLTVAPWLPDTFSGSKEDHIALIKMTSRKLKAFVLSLDENRLEEKFFFKRLNGEENMMAFYQMLAHVFNHSTYHRGQLVIMLRQVGFSKLSSTDLSVYYREIGISWQKQMV
jgi:uncharacterized damage-inducible protein DinB